MKFSIGDRVTESVYLPYEGGWQKTNKLGTVIVARLPGFWVAENYDVQWDSGTVSRCCYAHGLELESISNPAKLR